MADKSNPPSNGGSSDDTKPNLTWTLDDQSLTSSSSADGQPTIQSLLDASFERVEEVLAKIGEEIQHIPRNEVLNFFWSHRVDTPCITCQGDFSDNRGRPIRTYSLDGPALLKGQDPLIDLSKLVVRIHNRHLDCIKGSSV